MAAQVVDQYLEIVRASGSRRVDACDAGPCAIVNPVGPSARRPLDDVVRLVAADLASTMGWTQEQADRVARRTAVARAGFGRAAVDVAEEVQQWLHDTFLDTTWPACPEHGSHPLWLEDESEPAWTCPATRRRFSALGQLSTVVAVDDEVGEANRRRLQAEDRSNALSVALWQGARLRWRSQR